MAVQPPGRRRRRLAAILMADIAGFSRMMGRDEEGTTARVLLFHDAVKAIVEAHGGRVVATAGDSVFGDFNSVVDALECAEAIQRDLHAANAGVPAEERIDARMGLHLGDVIVEEYNVFGDGVNVAARLEQLADPGGIVLSEAVYQQVKTRSALPITEIGTRSLKNIEEPVRLYRIAPEAFEEIPVERPGTPAERPTVEASGEAARLERKEAFKERIREKIEKKIDEADIEAIDDKVVTFSVGKNRRGVGAVFAPGSLVPLAVGVLLVLARTSGWSENGWYPFIGCIFLGVAAGGMIESLSGRHGFRPLLVGIGVAVGAVYMDGTVMRAILWVISASTIGGGIQALARTGKKTKQSREKGSDSGD